MVGLVALVLGIGAPAPPLAAPTSAAAAAVAPLAADTCPTTPVAVLAVENFYGSLVQQLAGQCAAVTIILSDPAADPHEFQPTASDARAFQSATLIVENGLGYDDFADKAIATLSHQPVVVRAGDVLGLQVGANPHVWYSPAYVDQITQAIVSALKQVNPDAADYFDAQAAGLEQSFGAYREAVAQVSASHSGVAVASTESIFVYMAGATGLNLISPVGFMQALSEGTDPTARDLVEFQNQLRSKQARVLVYNVQTVTPTTVQLQDLARAMNIPVVGVSETMPPGAATFQDWQTEQLHQLLNALEQADAA
jgi:zinc/manganese transport system substrate-binding protein